MVLPKRKVQVSSSSTPSRNSYVILLVKIILVLLILLWMAPIVDGAKKRRRRSRGPQRKSARQEMQYQRLDCEEECLTVLLPEESMDCVQKCRSQSCYDGIYAPDGLEPGEIDLPKADAFDVCHLNEIMQDRRKDREERKNQDGNVEENYGDLEQMHSDGNEA